jgi:hypothetical protein
MEREQSAGSAQYVFKVRFRVTPVERDVSVDPSRFETTLYWEAARPGTDGWLFFRDTLWRGEVNAPDHVRELTEDALGVPVESVEFRELRTDETYLSALKEAIASHLHLFRADDVPEVLTKYLGSRIHVGD